MTRSPLNTVVYVGSSSGLEANATLVRSNYPRRDGELSRMLEKFSTVEEPLKNEFHILLEQLMSVEWRHLILKVLWYKRRNRDRDS